jgi:ABC-type lipoprotein release transport system permease subunit
MRLSRRVVSLSVASRKRDLGIKAALGASPRAIALDVLKYAAKQIGAGLALGAIAGTMASSYLRTAITDFEPTPYAPAALAFGLLLCVGVCACLAPALRATHIDPVAILQEE